jgi:hypothetical protein
MFAIMLLAPYAVIASATQFNPERSTVSQRAWTMSWLIVGQISLGLVPAIGVIKLPPPVWVFVALLLLVPAIGGFVTAGMMIKEFGSSTASI